MKNTMHEVEVTIKGYILETDTIEYDVWGDECAPVRKTITGTELGALYALGSARAKRSAEEHALMTCFESDDEWDVYFGGDPTERIGRTCSWFE